VTWTRPVAASTAAIAAKLGHPRRDSPALNEPGKALARAAMWALLSASCICAVLGRFGLAGGWPRLLFTLFWSLWALVVMLNVVTGSLFRRPIPSRDPDVNLL